MTAVRKQVDRESDPRKKIELMKKKLGLFPNGTSKPNLGPRMSSWSCRYDIGNCVR